MASSLGIAILCTSNAVGADRRSRVHWRARRSSETGFGESEVRAVITSFNLALGNYQARTDNEIAIAFSITDGTRFKLNDELEVNLQSLVRSQEVVCRNTGQVVRVKLRDIDLHDLRLPSGHGTSRVPSESRLSEA